MRRIKDIDGEVWRSVIGFPGYMVSDLGRFKRLGVTGDFELEGKVDRIGYRQIGLLRNGVQIWMLAHRVVASAFIDDLSVVDGQFLTVNHKNRSKLDNRLCNLELVTVAQNHRHWRRYPLDKPR